MPESTASESIGTSQDQSQQEQASETEMRRRMENLERMIQTISQRIVDLPTAPESQITTTPTTLQSNQSHVPENENITMELPNYGGKNLHEFTEFKRRCEILFFLKPSMFSSEKVKIIFSLQFLTEEAAAMSLTGNWKENAAAGILTWAEYESKLKGMVVKPSAEPFWAHERLKSARQIPGHSVSKFAAYIDYLEHELSEMPPERYRIANLYTGINDTLKKAAVRDDVAGRNTTRSDMLEHLMRIEASLSASDHIGSQKRNAPKFQEQSRQGLQGQSLPSRRKRTLTISETNQIPVEKRVKPSPIVCFRCNEPGHIAPNCEQKNLQRPQSRSRRNTPSGNA